MATNTEVSINLDPLGDVATFTSLSLHQTLADTCNGSFGYRDESSKTLRGQMAFQKKVMGKTVTVSIGDGFRFVGFVDGIRMHNEDGMASEYTISFTGVWGKLDKHTQCHAWKDKTFQDVVDDLAKGPATGSRPDNPIAPHNHGNAIPTYAPLKIEGTPESKIADAKLYWTVQYNKTRWQQLRFMAARQGAWLYYDGVKMHMDKPGAHKMTFTKGKDIFGISHSLCTVASPINLTGYNTFDGEGKMMTIDAPDPENGIHGPALSSGATEVTSADGSVHIGSVFSDEEMKAKGMLYQHAKTANTSIFTATTHDSGVTLGMLLKIEESEDGNDSHEFIVTQVAHSSSGTGSYTAYITMVPASIEVPPYSNPFLYTPADRMHGVVKDNHDKNHKKDRVQLYLPWMAAGSTTNWVDVLTGYAGKGKGHIWLPEVGEEVLIDFVSGDVERPFVSGALYTKNAASGRETDEGNHIKRTTTGSGRGFVIDDKAGNITFQDNEPDKFPRAIIDLERNDEHNLIAFASGEDDKNTARMVVEGKTGVQIVVVSGGNEVMVITMEKDGKKILIQSKGNIDLIADDTINLQAANININASKALKASGTSDGVQIEGQKVEMNATTDIKATANANLELSGMQAKLAGSAQSEVSSGALVKVQGAIVQIN